MDISGSIGLFGGESKLLKELQMELGASGEPARVCLADTPGAAWAGTHAAWGGGVRPSNADTRTSSGGEAGAAGVQMLIVPPGAGLKALSALPIEALRLDAETCAVLRELGLDTIGALGRVAPESLQARFGAETALRLKQADGQAPEPLDFLPPPMEFKARLEFDSPVVQQQPLKAAIGELTVRLCDQLAAAGVGARRFELRLHRSDGKHIRHGLRTARLILPASELAALLDEKMQAGGSRPDRGVGFDAVSLVASDTEPAPAEQADWLPGASPGMLKGDLARLVDRLCSRLDPEAVRTLVPRGSYLPERRWKLIPALDCPPYEQMAEGPENSFRAPLLILEQAEPVDAAATTPGGPPAWMRWRRHRYPLRRARGPKRVAPEWWRNDRQGGREYWLMEDDCGRCFHLYRELSTGNDAQSRWYVQGLAA